MDAMDPSIPPPPPATDGPVACKRHPDVQTGLRCVRCGDPICPDCMRPAAVGYQCPDCARGSRQEVHQPGRRIGSAAAGTTVTKGLLLVMVAVYVLEVAVDASSAALIQGPTTATLIKLGAIIPALVGDGEYWRLGTGIFLHAGLIHIALNGYALWVIGSVVESELGSLKYLVIFLVTGLFASACVFMFSGVFEPTVGASGAIFGLFGVFAAYNYRRRNIPFYAARLRTMLYLIVLNMVFTFAVPGISRAGHIGGLVGGLIVGLVMEGIGPRTSRTVAFWGVIAAMVAATFVLVAIRTPQIPPHAAEAVRQALQASGG
jgi:membrane associated rhomboid family serine protease